MNRKSAQKTFKLDMIRGSLEWKTKQYSLFIFLLPARQTVQPLFNADLRTTMEITMTTMTKTLMMMLRWWMITIITPVVPPAAAARAPPQFAEDAPARLCWPPTCKASHWLNADGVGENLNYQQTMVNDHLVLIGWCLPPARLETLRMGAAEGREGPKGR